MFTGDYILPLINVDLYGEKIVERRNGEGLMSVRVKKFQTYTLHKCDEVKDTSRRSHHAWLVPASFNPLRYVNDMWNSDGDKTPQMVREADGMKGNL